MLEISAEDADRFERKRKKKNPDQGFSGTLLIFKLFTSSSAVLYTLNSYMFSFLRGVYTRICLCYESVIQYIFLGACELVLMHEVTFLAEKSENFLEDNFFIFLWQILLQLNTDSINASPSK